MGSLNPLKLDPSKTFMIRRAFSADMSRRFARLRKQVREYLVSQNALGLTTNAPPPPSNPPNPGVPPYSFPTKAKKVKAFNRWLQDQINLGILEVSPTTGEPLGLNPWMYTYINSAYRKGVVRSYIQVRQPDLSKPMAHYEGTRAQFLEDSFSRPERTDKLRLLYTRSFEDLKGITAPMAAQMSRTLADGLVHGKGAQQIARELNRAVTKIEKKRALVITRTEVIHAHAEGQLDALGDLKVKKVGAEVEFTTSNDSGVCPKCKALEGKVYTVDAARGIIPVHPQCRCAWAPYIEVPGAKRKSA